MPSVAEIYCYSDPDFAGDINAIVEALRVKGHRLLVGEDLEELTLLLQLANPTLIVFAIPSEESILKASFQQLSKEALEKGMPMIIIGPEAPLDRFTLYTPRESRFEEVLISIDRLPDVVDNLHRKSIEPKPPEEIVQDEAELKLADVLGNGPDEVEIVTVIETGDTTRIVTSVSRAGVVLVREEQTTENSDPRIKEKMDLQHTAAAKAYSPAKPPKIEMSPPKYRGEISAPFVVATPGKDEKNRNLSEAKWVRPVQIISALGAIVLLGIFLYLFTRPSPSRVEDKEIENEAPESVAENPHMPPPGNDSETEALVEQSPKTDDDSYDFEEESAIPFPATFRTGKSVFFFQDEWEEKRFVNMIRGVPEGKTIRVVGHPTKVEAKNGDRSLGWSRAWSVQRYLVRRGISPKRLNATLGEPVTDATELDQNGRPRRRFVDIVIE